MKTTMKAVATMLIALGAATGAEASSAFTRISTFHICEQIDPTCNTDDQTNAETIWYYGSGSDLHLVYTDSESENLGFVDISNPSSPAADGTVPLGGEPTTVRVIGDYAVVGVNTSPDFVNPTGKLAVVDLESKTIVHEIELPGQPDAVSVSSNWKDNDGSPLYIAVAIENERDEDLGDGVPPQLPAGLVSIITVTDLASPESWTTVDVPMANDPSVVGACLYPDDPEPEYVAIHPDNTKVVVSLQENNCNVVIDLASASITAAFDAGSVTLDSIDTTEDGLILQGKPSLSIERAGEDVQEHELLREPDGIAWIGSSDYFATANEGDLDGGSRGWSIVDSTSGEVVYDSGLEMEWETARVGHYPDERSGNKGNEPENVFYSAFGEKEYVFVLSERSSVVFVYLMNGPTEPELVQILPVGTGPEGITTIPSQNLVAIASEVDERGDKIRSSITIFELTDGATPEYPTLVSASKGNSPSIPFAALSGLAADLTNENILYTIEDSFYNKNRIMTIDTSSFPAVVTTEQRIMDSDGVLAECLAGNFSSMALQVDVASMINSEDNTVNIDPEGISVSVDGGFWIASEGKGTVGDEDKPFAFPNLLLKTTEEAVITDCFLLPDDGSFADQLRFGFEGVAEDGKMVVVAVQRAWGDEPNPRLAIYDVSNDSWKSVFYPLDEAESQNGGWVGLSDISSLGDGKFLVLERDNQGGPDAAIKKIYEIDLGDYSMADGVTIEKKLVKDLVSDLLASQGQILEKVEGLAIAKNGMMWINTDNDGVDDSSGESLLMSVGIFDETGMTSSSDSDVDDITTSGAHAGFSIALLTVAACLAPVLNTLVGL